MSNVDVSVVVPCYNVERYVDQALSSVERNDAVSLEIIAVNDGSTDGTLSVLQDHANRDPRIRIIDKQNEGYGASVNRGFDSARGSYVAILEPDDYVDPHMYDELFALARSYGQPDIVKSSYWRICMPLTPQERRYHCAYYQRIKPRQQPFMLADCPRLIQHHPSIWSALYRHDFLTSNAIRLKEAPGAGWVDNPFLVDTMCRARSIVYTDKPFYNYREDLPTSSSANRDVALSFTRWNDMCDILDDLHVDDAGIRQALDIVGFRFAAAGISKGALEDAGLSEQLRHIFARMDTRDIVSLDEVSPALRSTALQMTGRTVQTMSDARYKKSLAKEFLYGWRTNGLSFAISQIHLFLKRRSERG